MSKHRSLRYNAKTIIIASLCTFTSDRPQTEGDLIKRKKKSLYETATVSLHYLFASLFTSLSRYQAMLGILNRCNDRFNSKNSNQDTHWILCTKQGLLCISMTLRLTSVKLSIQNESFKSPNRKKTNRVRVCFP